MIFFFFLNVFTFYEVSRMTGGGGGQEERRDLEEKEKDN